MATKAKKIHRAQITECWRLAKSFEKELKHFLLLIEPTKTPKNNKINLVSKKASYLLLLQQNNFFSTAISFLLENKQTPKWKKVLAETENEFLRANKRLSAIALNEQSYLEPAVFLLARLDLLYLSFGEKFNLPRGYSLLLPQFTEEQIEAVEAFKKNPAQGLILAWQFLAKKPQNKITYALISDFYTSLGEYKKALLFLELGARYNPSDYIIHYLWGIALSKTWRFNKSLMVLKRAAKLKGNDIEIQKNLGWVMVILGRFKGDKKMAKTGRNILKNVLRKDPTNTSVMVDLSQSYLMEHKVYTAFQWAKQAYNLNRQDNFTKVIYNNLEEIYKSYKQDKKFREFLHTQTPKTLPKEIINKDPAEIDEYLAQQFEIEFILEKLEQGEISINQAQKQLSLIGANEIIQRIVLNKKDPTLIAAKATEEYINYRNKLVNLKKRISGAELQEIINQLFSPQVKEAELKKIILILAHQGSKEALQALQKKKAKSSGWLKWWLYLAINECKTLLASKNKKKSKIVLEEI